MEPMTLSFGVMLGFLQRAIAEIKDPRLASNATRYSIKDTVLGAFSVFFMQCESFLEHQRQMHSRYGQDNAQSLFGLMRIPTTPQIRNILDEIAANRLFRVFTWVYPSSARSLYPIETFKQVVGRTASHSKEQGSSRSRGFNRGESLW
jgi:hypothetical protein